MSAVPATPVRILFVEDSGDDAALTMRALQQAGINASCERVQSAAELEVALASGKWDAILSDFNLPGFSGLDALRIFNANGADIPFILLSGAVGEEAAVAAMKAGASDFIMKRNLGRLAPALERELKESATRAELRFAQGAIAAGDKQFRQMADTIRDVFFLVDAASGLIRYANKAFETKSGRTVASVIGTPWINIIHPDDREFVMNENMAGRMEHEYRIRRPDGTVRWIDSRSFPVRDDHGNIVSYAGVARDITEMKQAKKVLLESERRFGNLLENVELISVMLDHEARITYCNPYLLRLTGWRPDEVVGKDWFETFMPSDLGDMKEVFADLLDVRPSALHHDNEIVTRSGERRIVRWSNSVLRSGDGHVIGTASIGEDITERKRTEADLLRFAGAMNTMEDAVIITDRASMRFVHVNDTACRYMNMSRQELLAMPPWEGLNVSRAELEASYDELIASRMPARPFEILRKRPDGGPAWVELRRQAQRTVEGWTIVTLARDVTEKKRRDEDLHRFRAAMEVSGDGILLIDRASMRYVDVNQTLCDLVGLSREDLIGKTPMEVFSATREELESDYDALIADNDSAAGKAQGYYRHRDGRRIPIETRRRAIRTDAGWIIVGTARDVTERNAAEQRIQRLNRVLKVLSGINTLIVHVSELDELFHGACRIAVEQGEFKMAWIGIADHRTMKIRPAASSGVEPEFLTLVADRFSLDMASERGNSMTARAVNFKKPVICNDLRKSPDVAMVAQRVERGIHSLVVLPIVFSGAAIGVLSLYAGEPDYFDDEEMKVLAELSANIAFAVDHIEKRTRLDYLASYDELTGLANRDHYLQKLTAFLAVPGGDSRKVAVLVIDIERFRSINESAGRQAGDQLLRMFAERLQGYMIDPTWLARIGPDQFATIIPDAVGDQAVEHMEQRMRQVLGEPFALEGLVVRLSLKVGIALFPDDGANAVTLLRNAEAALKKAKAGGLRHMFYAKDMTARVAENLALENRLRMALEREEFVLHYQPKINLQTGKLTSAEALIRWNDPETGLVPPGRFIPVLEETGLIHDVGRWALRRAVDEYLRWRAAGLPAVRIAVNVSPLQLRSKTFAEEIAQVIGGDPKAPEGLELEITESLIMEDVEHSIATLRAIRDMKVTIAIDDFGTGFSSLSYLSKLPVTTLKIDRSFIVAMMEGPDGLTLVTTIINLAHSLKLKVVAEGVETEEQSSLLRLLACDEMQGYLFSKPVPAEQFEARFLTQSS